MSLIQLLLLEFLLLGIAVLLARIAPGLGAGFFGGIERRLGALARRKRLAILSVGLFALFEGLWPRLYQGLPRPQSHDEFSYLLAGDTFAHGRLTNPTHPMWEHFESFHILQWPTYMSMYPPAQGMALAAGKLLGHPWLGVLASVTLMCVLITWMLQSWLPPGWALLGGAIAAMRLATFSYWIDTYFGGSVAAIGGALILGAAPRLMRRRRWRDALLLGAGIAIVANSRPFEGVALSLPVVGAGCLGGPRLA